MGKTKTKVIDDSQVVEESKKTGKPKDALVEKLKAELGIKEEVKKSEPLKAVVTETKKKAKPTKSRIRSKKYQEMVKDLDRSISYPLDEAIKKTKKLSLSKFDGTLEIHINTSQSTVRGLVSLPYFVGKKLKILAFGPSTALRTEDGVTLGNDETIEQISKGKIDFDLVVTTPEWMPKLAKVAKNLGPRGLMPNPKNGTITDDLKKAVASFQAGKTEYKTENKAAVIHLGVGKLSQPNEELISNVKTLLTQIGKTRIKKVALSPTMGPSIKLDLTSF